MTYRYDAEAIQYTEIEKLREALIGKRIHEVRNVGDGYSKTIEYDLGGTMLVAHATHGGCACSNGCFSVDTEMVAPNGTIMNVEIEERVDRWTREGKQIAELIEPGSIRDGNSVIRIFVYTELGKQELVASEGGDNGYYGWGFWLSVEPKVLAIPEGEPQKTLNP